MTTTHIAERHLQYQDDRGDTHGVTVRLGAPQVEQDGAWRCAYEIDGLPSPGQAQTGAAFGIDAVQALILALVAIGGALETAPEPVRKRLHHLGLENLGFPRLSDANPSIAEIVLR